jgi:hypothetical protein
MAGREERAVWGPTILFKTYSQCPNFLPLDPISQRFHHLLQHHRHMGVWGYLSKPQEEENSYFITEDVHTSIVEF